MKIATLSLKRILIYVSPNFKFRHLAIIAFFFCLQFGYAQPINDNFANATIVPHTPNWCSAVAAYTTLNATPDGVKGSAWANGPNYNVWFKFLATTTKVNAQVNIGVPSETMRYPFVALWDSSGVEITSSIYYSATSNINVESTNLIIGNWYYVSVDNYAGNGYRGTFSLCVENEVDYDYKEAAITVPHTSSWCSADAAYTTLNATPDGAKGSAWPNGPNYNVWFKFQATTTQVNAQVNIGGTSGSMRYPFTALWNSSGVEITSSIYYTSTSNINVQSNNLTVGDWYYISVDNYGSTGYRGTFSLCIDDKVNYDYKEGAITVPHTPNWCSPDAAYSTLNATPDGVKGAAWSNGPNYNVWFKFQATTTQVNAQVNTGGTTGTMRYPFTALWNSSGVEITSSIYYSATSSINVQSANLIVGEWYYISVDNYVGVGYRGTFSLCVEDIVDYDFYDGAKDVTSLINSCSVDAAYDTQGGSPDKLIGSAWNGGPRYNRWFKFTAPTTGQINIEVQRGGTKGTQRYSQVALWQSDGTTEITSKRYISINDDVVMGASGLTPGATYYISVDAYSGYYGTFSLCLQDKVDYDFYEGAMDVTSLINSCSADAAFDSQGGSPDKLKGSAWNGGPLYNRWFKFTAPTTGQINIAVQRGGTKGTQRYSQVALWQADGTTEIESKRYISINDDVVMGAIGLTPGTTYYISVDAYSGYYGTFTLCLQDKADYDFYEGAMDVTSLINSCSADGIYDTRGATPDKARGSSWNNNGPLFNRWFKFTAPATGEINVTVQRGGSKGTQGTTQVALWQANGTTEITSKRYIAAYDDVVIGAIGLTPGATYYISVDAYSSSYFGTFTLCLQDKVDYDFYEGAIDVTSLINSCSTDGIYDTRGGSPDKAKGSNWNNNGPLFNRWFKFTAPATGEINVTVQRGGTKGTQGAAQVALWQSNGTTEITSKRYISAYDDVVIGATGLTPGTTYYISVDAVNSSYFGTFSLCLQDKVDYDFYEGAFDVTTLINSCSPDGIYDTRGGTPDKAKGSNWNNNGPLFNRWFKFTAPATGEINVTVQRGGTKGTQGTAQVALWQANGITEITSKRYISAYDDVVIGAIGLTPGATYYISVDAYSGYYGTFSLCLQDQVDYDFYEGATDVTDIINSCSADAIYDTRGGTPDKGRGSIWNNNGPVYNRWFKFTAPATGEINITLDVGGTKGNQRTTQLALWQANGTTEITSKRYVGINDDVVMGATGLTPGATYYISVDAYPGYYGTFSLCLQDINGLPNYGPGGIRQDLRLWLKGDIGTNTTVDGASINTWNDQGKGSNAISTAGQQPIFKNNAIDNINYNAVLDFSGNKSMYGEFASGFFSHDVFAVVIPNETINNATPKMTIFSGEISPASINDLTGIGLGNYTGAISNEILTYAQGDESSYRAAEVNASKSYLNALMINARNNALGTGMELFQNANQVDNTTVGSGFANIFGGKYWIGKNKSDGQGSLNGRVAEIITFSTLKNSSDRSKIESYLAIKYGITLGVNGTSQNYVNSSGSIIWDISANSGFNYDIAGIGRDNAVGSSLLAQKQSKSINPTDYVTIGLGVIKASNSLNNYIFNVDKSFLLWGNNNDVLNNPVPANDRTIALGTSIQTSIKLTGKKWKIVETGGDIAEVTVSIPETILTNNFPKSSSEEYALVVSSTPGFENNNIIDVIPLQTVGSDLQAWYDFDGVKYFCFAKTTSVKGKLQLNIASGDYLLGGDNINLNSSFTMSAWIQNAAPGTTRTFIGKGTDYAMSLNSANRIEVAWNGGVKISSKVGSTLTDLKWHHVAVTFSAGTAKLYIDGILDQTVNSLANPMASTAKFSIGGLYSNKGAISNYFMSNIDEVRIWDVALTPSQLQYLMNQEMEKYSDNTINGKILPQYLANNDVKTLAWSSIKAYYDLNTLCGTSVEDKSDNSNFLRIKYLTSNKQMVSLQTAPLPYTSISDGSWDSSSTWTNGTIWTLPNALGVDGVTRINWNIIETNNSIFTNRSTTLLGLMVNSNILTVNGDNKIDISHYLKLNGKMDLEGESQLIQGAGSYLDPKSSGTLERDQQGNSNTYIYNYWCSPVGVSNNTTNNNSYTLQDIITNVGFLKSGYNGSASPVKNADYWIWKYSNLTYGNYSAWQHIRSTGSLATGEGFTMKGPGTATPDQNYILLGKPNNGDFSLKLGVGNEYLIGNPYPSAMDADEFIKDNIGNTETNGRNPAGNVINGALYFWDHFANNTHTLAEYEGGYATYTLMGGTVAISNDTKIKASGKVGTKTPGRYIPVAQGFFVNSIKDPSLVNDGISKPVVGGDILFKNSQRVFATEASASSTFMKSPNVKNKTADSENEKVDTRQKIRLNMDSPKGFHRQLLVGADENASNNFDIGYDAPIVEDNKEDMFWIFNNANFIIQAVNNFDAEQKLPLGLKISKAGLTTIKIDALENIENNQVIYLHDKTLNLYHNLKESDYEVFLTVGKHLDRFELTFSSNNASKILGTDNMEVLRLLAYYSNENASIILYNPGKENIESVELFNIIGQSTYKLDNVGTKKYSAFKTKNLNEGIYILNIKMANGHTLSKKVLVTN